MDGVHYVTDGGSIYMDKWVRFEYGMNTVSSISLQTLLLVMDLEKSVLYAQISETLWKLSISVKRY